MILLILFLSILCLNLVLSGPVSAATININESSAYNTSSVPLNQEIQTILDSASIGDTVEFMGSYYESLSLVISKPLNIISHKKTLISSNLTGPIFLISGPGSSGTNITGFNLQANNTDGIVIKNSGKIKIYKNNLSSVNGTVIRVTGSSNINIYNNQVNNSKTGLSITNSKNVAVTKNNIKNNANNGVNVIRSQNVTINKNQISKNGNDGISADDSKTITLEENSISKNDNNGITLKNTSKTKINKNKIDQNKGHGVYYDQKVNDTRITNNNIINNQGIGIDLDKSGANTYINGNIINTNKIGININDSSDNLVISQNLITGSVRNAVDEISGVGINFGVNYWYFSTFNVNNNAVFSNQRREVEIKDTLEPVVFGANWYGHSDPGGCNLCPKCKTQYIKAVVTQSPDGIYRAMFYTDYPGGVIASMLPSFEVYFYLSDGTVQTVLVKGGMASIKVDPPLTVTKVKATFQRFLPGDFILQYTNQNPTDNDNSGNSNDDGAGGGSDSDSGNGDSSGSNGNSGSGSSSGSSSNDGTSTGNLALGAAAEASSSSAGSSAGQDSKSSQGKSGIAQELFINYPMKDPQIWSIIGVVVLILLVILAYYRRSLMEMIKNSK